jgi:hypothetical protein
VPSAAWGAAGWANLFWVLAYDTEYAMVDRDDDLRIGMKTSAITLGRFDVAARDGQVTRWRSTSGGSSGAAGELAGANKGAHRQAGVPARGSGPFPHRRGHGLQEIKHVGRAGARQRGDRVELLSSSTHRNCPVGS